MYYFKQAGTKSRRIWHGTSLLIFLSCECLKPHPAPGLCFRNSVPSAKLPKQRLQKAGFSAASFQPAFYRLSAISRKKADFHGKRLKPPGTYKNYSIPETILDLKILQVFFKNREEILVFEKLLNFLSFLVLLYVSGHFKQKKIFQNFSD